MPRRNSFALFTPVALSLSLASLVSLVSGAAGCQHAATPPVSPGAPPASLAPAQANVEPPSPHLDEIVARYVQARGGAARLHAIRSLRLTGTARFGGDGDFTIEASFAVAEKRLDGTRGRIRQEVSFQGLTGVDAYDGTEGWSTEPWEGRRDPFRKSADEAKLLAHDADFDGPLVDWREKGHHVDYLGTEELDGTSAHKLRIVRKDGDVEYRYLDPDAFLEIRIVTESHVRGVEQITETDVGDYEQVAGVYLPFSMESGRKGAPRTTHITIERAEANVDLDDGQFAFPAAGTKVTRSIVAGPPGPAQPPSPLPAAGGTPVIDSGIISGLGARNIGSAAMSGRVAAVAAQTEGGKTTVYVGAASGGVWKSLDGGTSWRPVFDKNPVQSIGAIAIDPSHGSTLWVGTGESWTRNSVSVGDGIYRSTDAGATWKNMGLSESERITRILIHPNNGDVVYACVPGKLWSDSAERGVYKTADGGKTWTLVLKGPNLSTGCSGLSMDPKNPDVVFAGLWDFRRKGWTFRSGGDGPDAASGSGLYRTADGGKSWTEIKASTNKGIPPGPWGRVEVAVAPSDAKVVYALIESKESTLLRSGDGGVTWEPRDKSRNMVWRPFYFARLVVDPTTPDRLFKPDYQLIVSDDGGRSFSGSGGGSHGDWHDLWIDPGNPKHIIGGDDGGLWISWDGGSRWWKSDNLPISQFYHVSIDARDPYQVYGGLQDNSSWVGDSAYPGGITNSRWENLYGGDGFWAHVDPTDPDAVYAEMQGGYIGRIDRKTRAARDIQPKAGYHEKLRFNWNTPIHVSPTQKGTIYIGAQFLFRSRDRGDTWERISPDLTTNDPEKQKQEQSGGVTVDNSSAEMHTTIYSISESPRDPKLLWVGTDDGNLQVSRDAGKTWTNVAGNVEGLPKFSWVSWVEASPFDAGTAFAAFDRHTFGDMTPWVYRTTDFGKTWTRIVGPDKGVRGYAHVVRQDVVKRELLFVGTELGLWISIDGGAKWAEFKGGDFPSVAVREVEVHPREHDLVIATHGRGIWIVDDLTPLRALTADMLARPAVFLPGRPVQQRMPGQSGWSLGDASFVGQNPPSGAVITYYERTRHIFGRLKLEVLDDSGKVIDTINATKRRGINRVTWTMQVKAPRVPRAAQVAINGTQGPRIVPGKYTVRLTKGADVLETKLDVSLDRRAPFGVAERKANFDATMRAHALFGEMSTLTDRIDAAHAAAEARAKALTAGDALVDKLRSVMHKLEEAKKKIVATKEGGAITGEERIREHLDLLYGALIGWEGRPARYQLERIDVLRRELTDVAKQLDTIAREDVRPLDDELRKRHLDPIPTTAALTGDADEPGRDASAAMLRCVRSRGTDCAKAEKAVVEANNARGQRD
jgi:photosystem II stability/assembly factor-like uncharacterized protein